MNTKIGKSVGIHVSVNNLLKDSRGRKKSRRKVLGNNEQATNVDIVKKEDEESPIRRN